MTRDFAEEMRKAIEHETGSGPYVARVAAAEVVARLRLDDPELLAGWLDLHAEDLVWRTIGDRDRSLRAQARANAGRSRFRDAADAAAGGNMEPMHRLLDMPFVLASGERVPLKRMTAADCAYVASGYELSAHRAGMHAALLRALERHIGNDRVEDHFTEEQLRALWESFDEA